MENAKRREVVVIVVASGFAFPIKANAPELCARSASVNARSSAPIRAGWVTPELDDDDDTKRLKPKKRTKN
jgi:hypothetical protein